MQWKEGIAWIICAKLQENLFLAQNMLYDKQDLTGLTDK